MRKRFQREARLLAMASFPLSWAPSAAYSDLSSAYLNPSPALPFVIRTFVPYHSIFSTLYLTPSAHSSFQSVIASTMPPQSEAVFLDTAFPEPTIDALIIFDFDSTIIEFDSDPWVVDHLGATELMNSLRTYLPWNDMMDTMMAALRAQGKSIADIQESLRILPLQTEKAEAIKAAYELGCEVRIVSDANAFFINTILEAHNLDKCFTQIHTNPAYVDEEGALRLLPFHPKSEPPHGCPLCPPNMCKGRVIDSILASLKAEGKKKRVIYVGDGSGDYCPSLRLRVGDYVLPREGYPLQELLHENAMKLKAKVKGWKTAQDMAVVLLNCLTSESQE